jgi:TPR repeat protein
LYKGAAGVPQDQSTAAHWLELAATQGHAKAQLNLGVLYDRGHGVTQDATQAVRWYRQAAEQGNRKAQLNLGLSYATGRGVAQDYIEAYKWFSLAAQTGNNASAAQYRDRAATLMTPDDLSKAKKSAHEWLQQRRAR